VDHLFFAFQPRLRGKLLELLVLDLVASVHYTRLLVLVGVSDLPPFVPRCN
jgi:hypothetical protein